MAESPPERDLERARLLRQLLKPGDFRRGSIAASIRRRGKPACHCAQPNDRGHDPEFRLSRKENGKTVNESFATPAARLKSQREVAEFQRFQQLGEQLASMNRKVCALCLLDEEGRGRTAQDATILHPYSLCGPCHCGQFPVDLELDVENTELPAGVRRMMTAAGHEAGFDEGRQQMELLAGLSVATKAVERTAEAIGEEIEVPQQRELERALQPEFPPPAWPRTLRSKPTTFKKNKERMRYPKLPKQGLFVGSGVNASTFLVMGCSHEEVTR
jgi:hypothetical protein